ncbi:sigma factor [Nonomuraea angiospora]|uniref:sigma factor n=1 Tax=Nonomuraea angiospora TaxID=46172 RepID=UPI0033E682AE
MEDFDEFVRARGDALLRYGFVLAGNSEDAADLVQEALARLGDAWPRVRKKHDPEGYVRTTARALQNRVVNLETGESIEVSLPDGVGSMQCHPEWCAGRQGLRGIVQRVDGSEPKILPQELQPRGLLGDRYAIFGVLDAPMKRGVPLSIVYDFETGVMAKLGERPFAAGDGMVGNGYSTSPSTTPFWWTGSRVQDAKEYIVLNLAAIPR